MSATQVILHVEDDPNDVLLVQRAFRKVSAATRIQTVSDGELATKYLRGDDQFSDRTQHPLPNLVLLDLKLPRKNGFEVLSWLRSQPPPLNRLPVVVLTSSNQTSDINRAYEIGANAYMVKPTGFEELSSTVGLLVSYWMVHSQKPDVRNAV